MSEFSELERWEKNVGNIGHGEMGEMSPEDAIKRAAECEPIASLGIDENDPQGLTAGMAVSLSPDVDGGEQPVEGTVVSASSTTITVQRTDKDAGNLHIHFPRAGYRVTVG